MNCGVAGLYCGVLDPTGSLFQTMGATVTKVERLRRGRSALAKYQVDDVYSAVSRERLPVGHYVRVNVRDERHACVGVEKSRGDRVEGLHRELRVGRTGRCVVAIH